MSEAGAVDGVDVLFGFHIGFKAEGPGSLICGTQGFLATTKRDVLFSGVPAHAGAAPEEGKDALLAACSAVVNLHAISRNGKGGTRIAVGRLEGERPATSSRFREAVHGNAGRNHGTGRLHGRRVRAYPARFQPICGAALASGGLWGTVPGEGAARSLPALLLRSRKRWVAGRRLSR